jgi:hypothetical protein
MFNSNIDLKYFTLGFLFINNRTGPSIRLRVTVNCCLTMCGIHWYFGSYCFDDLSVEEIECDNGDWFNLAQDWVWWPILADMVVRLWVS